MIECDLWPFVSVDTVGEFLEPPIEVIFLTDLVNYYEVELRRFTAAFGF